MTESCELYDRLWLWNELGELSSLLRWPAAGCLVLYMIWTAGTRPLDMAVRIVTAIAICAAVQIILAAGIRVSDTMVRKTVYKLDRILFGVSGRAGQGGDGAI